MNTAKKMIFENETANFENEPVIGLDDVSITPLIAWHEITLSNERINAVILEAIAEFNDKNN